MTKPLMTPLPLAIALVLPFLAGCHKQTSAPAVAVAHAWVRLPAVAGGTGAGYFTATANAGDTLLGVSAPGARIELHETMNMGGGTGGMGGMSGMRPLASVALPAGEAVRFAPGGRHLMIFGLDPKLKKGGTLPLTFRFRKAPPVTATAQLVGPADPPPADGD